MKIEFTKFVEDQVSVKGTVDDGAFTFDAKLWDGNYSVNINGGRVGKLIITAGKDVIIASYYHGWIRKPRGKTYKDVYDAIIEFLEQAPYTRMV